MGLNFRSGLAVLSAMAIAWAIPARGERVAASNSGAQSSGSAANDGITLTISVERPVLSQGADGLYDISIEGLDNTGDPGAPFLPVRTVLVAIPQGKTVVSAKISPLSKATLANGITLRHAEKPVHFGSAPAGTPRDEGIYGSADPYPEQAWSGGRTVYKNGVAIYELVLNPVWYRPQSGEVGYYPEFGIELTLAAKRTLSGAGAKDSAGHMPFIDTAARRAAAAALVENPDAVSGYTSEKTVRRLLATDENGPTGLEPVFEAPSLPCSPTVGYTHVVIAGGAVTNHAHMLSLYRRKSGITSTTVSVDAILAAYSHGGDRAATIREFIRDAYQTWGTDYVVLAGDTEIIPARALYCKAGEEVDEIPSDLYYQCLDGDFDFNGNGIYGEAGDGPGGGDIDFYAEVKIGRVSAENDVEFRNWFGKLTKYDEDAMAAKDYTRGALFLGEYLGPYPGCFATPLMEQIRFGTKFSGANGGFESYGFADAPDLFDEERLATIYDTTEDGDWTCEDVAKALVTSGYSVINHMGHSNADYNMRFSNADADSLQNDNPFFVYSQGCIAGAIDEDCVAEHFTTSTGHGAFGGVWNARYGWYQPTANSVSPRGPSQYFHRRFWDAIFRDDLHELGDANAASHERNAAMAASDGYMRWCLYETNLFGDPMQAICGPIGQVSLDREAYRSDATMEITYASGVLTNNFTASVTFSDTNNTAVLTVEVLLPYTGEVLSGKYLYRGQLDLSTLYYTYTYTYSYIDEYGKPRVGTRQATRRIAHDFTISVIILEEGGRGASAYIDDVAPAFADVRLLDSDDGEMTVSWKTYKPESWKSDPASGIYTYEETLGEVRFDTSIPFSDPQCATSGVWASSHSHVAEGLPYGFYNIRILAEDKAGNTNMWKGATVTNAFYSVDPNDYGTVLLTPRDTKGLWDMERDTAAWTTDDESCWQLGIPTYGPENASRCWGTVLSGRHPNGANASLISPAVHLRNNPTISFRHWYDILRTPVRYGNNDGADYGVIEVMAVSDEVEESSAINGSWVNVAQYAKKAFDGDFVQGTSDGWESVRITLPKEFANKQIRIRFRFVSDTFPSDKYPEDYPAANLGNPAGWYIDTVRFMDVPYTPGTIIEAVPQDGSSALVVEQGSSVSFGLRAFNVGEAPMVVSSASLSLSASGVAAGLVNLDGGSPVALSYGTIAACAYGYANETLTLSVDESVPVGTAITLMQTIRTNSGAVHKSSLLLRVGARASISGTVVQPPAQGLPSPNPVCGARVAVNSSDGLYTAETGADGSYSFNGFPSNSAIRVVASYGEAAAHILARSPTDSADIELPLSEFNLSTNEVSIVAKKTDADFVVDAIVISNVFNLAALDGNQGPSAPLEYSITGNLDENGVELDWFKLTTTSGSIAPGEALVLGIEICPSAASASFENIVKLEITSSGWNLATTNVTIKLAAEGEVVLTSGGLSGSEGVAGEGEDQSLYGDGDGLLEPGETGDLVFKFFNTSEEETISSFSGTVMVTDGDATIVGDNAIELSDILPRGYKTCSPAIKVTMGYSDTVEFTVTGIARHGAFVCDQTIVFTWSNRTQSNMDGVVIAENLFPADPLGETNGVLSARVSATDADGAVFYSNYTPSNGVYSIPGLVSGTKYWIKTEVPVGSAAVPPPSFCITADAADFSTEIRGTTYGEDSGHLCLTGFKLLDSADELSNPSLYANGDGHVGNGETIRIIPVFRNDGANSVQALRAKLSIPEFERTSCMNIVPGSDDIAMGEDFVLFAGGTLTMSTANGYFEATVNADATYGDYQRFIIEVWEDSALVEPKHWYFDIKIDVNPRYAISGTVLTESGNAPSGVFVAVAEEGSSITNRAAVNSVDGSWAIGGLMPGNYVVSVANTPAGKVARPSSKSITLSDADVKNVAFMLEDWNMVPGGEAYNANGGNGFGSLSLTVAEGESSTSALTITAGGNGDSLEVSIAYDRKASEALTRKEIEAAAQKAEAALAAEIGNDWRNLDPEKFSSDEYEFLFTDDSTIAERNAYLARRGFSAAYHFKTIPAVIATPGATVAASALASSTLANAPARLAEGNDAAILVSAQPAVIGAATHASAYSPDDPLYAEQWALRNFRQTGGSIDVDIGAEKAWEYAQSTGSRDVLVAVTDTGIEYWHPDLNANWSGLGYNYALRNRNLNDQHGHGTHVAGIIGAVGGNSLGVVGVNWKVSLMSQRICAKDASGRTVWATSARIAQSFEDAYLQGAAVNNNSWGSPFFSKVIYKAMEKAQDYDMLFVCSAGNDAYDLDENPNYPASMSQWLDNVIVVAATDADDNIASFSGYSPKHVHLAAPGVDILSTAISSGYGAADGFGALAGSGNYVLMSGTSMATPYVAGAAAFLKATVPGASYGFIKNAILQGVRVDPKLEEYVATAGHLDLATSVRLLGAQWLRFGSNSSDPVLLSTNITITAGERVSVPLLLNDPARLRAGSYNATITISGESSITIPATLKVTPSAITTVASVETIEEETDDDLNALGETVTLGISLRNAGSLEFENLSATLQDASGGTILSPNWEYGYIPGSATSTPGEFQVVLPASGSEASYTLVVREGETEVARLPISVALFNGIVLEVTVADGGEPVEGAEVELLGGGAGRGTTDSNGVARVMSPASASGECQLRVTSGSAIRHVQNVGPSAGSVAVELSHATIAAESGVLALHVAEGKDLATNAVLSATSSTGVVPARIVVAKRSKVAVFDDRDDSALLVERLRGMGFDVDYFPSNFIYSVYTYGPSEYAEIIQAPRYTWDDAAMRPYDAVIAIISGANGSGRLLAELEEKAYESYTERGGIAILSGVTPLSSPDNTELAVFTGLSTNACESLAVGTIAALAARNGLGAPFVDLMSGDAFAVASGEYDASLPNTFESGECEASMSGSANVAKIYASERSMMGGRLYLWNGNSSDWQHDGAALDVLRGTLYDELVASNPVDWLSVDVDSINVADGEEETISLSINSRRTLAAGLHEASILLMADVDGAQCVPLTVSLTVDPPAIRAYTSGAVTDSDGRPLRGDGGENSCLFQLVWVGPDGVPSEPGDDGVPGGDDVVMASSGTLLAYGRIGDGFGVVADSGAFDALFNLGAEGFSSGDEGIGLYVRAWDSPSFSTAISYGDSAISNVVWNSGLPGDIDFGSWTVSNIFQAVATKYDGNFNGIPDVWAAIFRPDIDTHSAPAAINTAATCGPNDFFATTEPPSASSSNDGNPARVFVTDKFVFVLECCSHRIAVHDRTSGTNLFYYGATANGGAAIMHHVSANAQPSTVEGAFKKPYGMALDTVSGKNRFAVADTENHRVQLFEFDPETAEITFVSSFGSQSIAQGASAEDGTFYSPYAVAFLPGNGLLVADTGNSRVARLAISASGTMSWQTKYQFSDKDIITGLCYAKFGREGFWIANSGPERQCISYYYSASADLSEPIVSVGTPASHDFTRTHDVQIWKVGSSVRIAATDLNGSRLRIFDPLLDSDSSITGVVHVADVGHNADASIQDHEKLLHPIGVFPIEGTNIVYVADNWNHRVVWYSLSTDGDGDGMEDFWEAQHGLNPADASDATRDADGDGLINIGEYIAGTDPQERDTDGDGHGDYYEMTQLTDPLDPDSYPGSEEPDPPVEETEEVGLRITSIALDQSGIPSVTLTWDLPTENLPADGSNLTFKLGVKFSLADEWNWSLEQVPSFPQGAGTASMDIVIANDPYASASQAFFTLKWTNKVKVNNP